MAIASSTPFCFDVMSIKNPRNYANCRINNSAGCGASNQLTFFLSLAGHTVARLVPLYD